MNETHSQRLLAMVEERKEFIIVECGDWVWWPNSYHYGCFTSRDLRCLADEIDRRNGVLLNDE